eukprot:s594_g5.t1
MTDRRALRPQYHDLCTRAVADARLLDSQGEFQETSEIVIDGLLGEGSGRTAALTSQGADSALAQLDEVMMGFAQGLSSSPSACDIGARGTERTAGLVHEAGWAEDAPPTITEVEAQRWLPTFLRHQVMLILFLGPGRGVLELQPYDEDGHPFRLATEPGMLATVRTDSLWRRFSCTPGAVSYSLSCFLVSPGEISLSQRTPVAEKLDLWLLRQIEDAAATNQDERWSYALDHLYHKTEQYAIRGLACKLSVHWDTNHLCRAIFAGSDMATEVPSARWDHEQYYSTDPDCWKMIKVGCKHTTMTEGVDLFDARFFRSRMIAPAEVKGMDPMQRQILEVGYAALFDAGQTSKKLLQSLTAVYVGAPTSEWTLVDQGPEEAGGCAQRSAGTGVAASIMSNRFSFVFGMNGPSVFVRGKQGCKVSEIPEDEAEGILMLRLCGKRVIEVSLVEVDVNIDVFYTYELTPLTWINRFAMGHMTKVGRCFAYDESSDGWYKSEHFLSIAVDRLTNTVDGVQVHFQGAGHFGITLPAP